MLAEAGPMSAFPNVDEKMSGFVIWIATLGWREREAVLDHVKANMCMYCGGEPDCYCWNDE